MLNFDEVSGMIVRKFCGLSVEEDEQYTMMCINEAVGEVTAEVEGAAVNIPVCQQHLDMLHGKYDIDSLDNTGATLLE